MTRYQTILGIDEAGLGPILGPLTIGYSAFRLPAPLTGDELLSINMWTPLGLTRNPKQRKRRPVVCDSKKLYAPAKGVHALEEEILGWLMHAGHDCAGFAGFRESVCALGRERPETYEWYVRAPEPFPLEATVERARLRRGRIERGLNGAGYGLVGLGVLPLLEGELNGLMSRLGSKARAEFEGIARILGPMWQKHRNLAVVCDRQGGRTRYGRTLASHFPEAQIKALVEDKALSTYELSIPEVEGVPQMLIAFAEKGDRDHLPVALASMAAKYLRELFMHQFNAWFLSYDAGLKPTAGYFKDGRRWLEDSAELRRRIGVDESRLIRQR